MLVIKAGGSEGISLEAVCADVAELVHKGQQLVLVHGGSNETNIIAEKLGHPPRFVTSVSGYQSRRTDRETLAIFEMVYCGKINKSIVEQLQALGVNAVGLSGLDGRLLEGPRKRSLRIVEGGRRMVLHDDYTGKVKKVNVNLLRLLLDNGYLPVITPPAISNEHEAINVDGDRAAARIASALNAELLIILSNVPGLLRSFPDETTLIHRIDKAGIEEFVSHAQGRMRIKMLAATEALQDGVKRVILSDGRVRHPVRAALAGKGTLIE
ncbi:MAG: [LysW]-aminoadipate kinase [Chloroflexota bacterium]|nr:[LysW]-aminoadipate kinase [Anaerolineae bacterium]